MARKLPATDVVIVGLGWTGSILAHELAASGLNVVAIERGPWRDTATDFPPAYAPDELRYHIRHDLFLRPAQVTMTFRNKAARRRCQSAAGARSCRRMASVAEACIGTRRLGAFCRATSR